MSEHTGTTDREGQLIGEIEAAVARSDWQSATALAQSAFPDGIDHPLILRLLAQQCMASDNYDEAIGFLERAKGLAPRDAGLPNDIGHCLSRMGRLEEAMAAFDEALRLDPQSLTALCNKAAGFVASGRIEAGRLLYEQAARLHPGQFEPLSELAALAVRQGDVEGARAYAQQALAISPNHPQAGLALAQADLEAGEAERADARLRAMLNQPNLGSDLKAVAHRSLGDALDRLDRTADAFAAYTAANEEAHAQAASPLLSRNAESAAGLVDRLIDYFETAPTEPWSRNPGPDAEGGRAVRSHVFLVGFPRSGTTLIEQVLASHPGVVSLEETDALAEQTSRWLADAKAIDALSEIGPEDAERARRRYWRRVRQLADLGDGGKVLVDKLPLHTVRLSLIAKLFPDARILMARRDPRDVAWSCFRRGIRLESVGSEFLTLGATGRYYDRVMHLAETYLEKLPLNVHVVRHEAFVDDFEGETTTALSFVGLSWDEAVRSFAARAKRLATTPSAAQVARGLNAEGIGQWRRYKTQLADVLPVLEPWVLRFGYPPSQGGEPSSPQSVSGRSEPTSERGAQAAARLRAAMQQGEWARAFDIAESAIGDGVTDPLFFKIRALRREQQGRLHEAIADFETAAAAAPGEFATLNALGLCLARVGRLGEAMERLDAAMAIEPNYAPIHFNRAWTLENLGELGAARASYERAIELDPKHAQALGNLAFLAIRASDARSARSLATRALALDATQPTGRIALAQAEMAEGALDLAERRLRHLLEDRTRPSLHDRSIALTVLGDILDLRERPADAFEAYRAANQGLHALHGPRFAGRGVESGYAFASRLLDDLASIPHGAWPPRTAGTDVDSTVSGHVFLLGFPRSGTTLLGQVLAAHPRLVTLDERETLTDASQALLRRPGDLARLAASEDSALEPYRRAYWRRVREAGLEVDGKVFVDKLPMNTLGLPLIARLFPRAKVVFMRRDPRDVVLSCFRRQFVIGPSTWELLSLDGAARFYDVVMRFADGCLGLLDLDVRVQRHEDLIADFEGETRALLDFIGLEREPSMTTFAEAFDAASIATPSAAQISRGLSTEGVGHWRRYRAQLAPVLPQLAPWVERFGYPAD